jgi:hypothetical protein
MTVKINMYTKEGDDMVITLDVTHNQEHFFVTKSISVVEGKTKEQYVSDAYNSALAEINVWKDDIEIVGQEYNPSTKKFM